MSSPSQPSSSSPPTLPEPLFRFATIDTVGRDREIYTKLHNTLFVNTAMSFDWLDWYHSSIAEASPATGAPHHARTTRTHGVFDDATGELVGVWSVEPKTYLDADLKPHRVGRCFAVGIHPDYRRHGLFVRLSQFAISQERELGEYQYIFGFPQQGRPVIGGHLKAGWDVIQNFDMLYFNPAHLTEYTSLKEVRTVTDFTQLKSHDHLASSFLNSSRYRNQKWLAHPDNHYICLERGGSYVVLKPYDNVCHILDLQADPSSRDSQRDLTILLNAAKTLARRHRWREINTWAAPQEIFLPSLREAGFLIGSELSPAVVLLAVRIRAQSPLRLGAAAHFHMGVEEIY